MNEIILQAAILIIPLIIAIVFHEVAHGYTAKLLGDPTAAELGRLSLNPIRHVDPVGTILFPGALALMGLPVLGWAKPVPVVQQRLRNPRYGMMAVAAAGPGSNFLLAGLGAIVAGLVAGSGLVEESSLAGKFVLGGLYWFLYINLFVGVFNLLPIPPFDGSHVVEGLLPRRAVPGWRRFGRYGMLPIIALIVVVPWLFPGFNPVGKLVGLPFDWLMQHYKDLEALFAGG